MNAPPSASGKMIEMRRYLAAHGLVLAPRAESVPLVTGVTLLDEAGVSRGSLAEVVESGPGSGGATLCREVLAAAAGRRERVALVDGADVFDPGSCDGVERSALLWVRCRSVTEALKAADLLVRDGNLPLVLLDLVLSDVKQLRESPAASWFRLRTVAEESGVAALVFTPRPLVGAARVRLALTGRPALSDLDTSRDRVMACVRGRVERRQADAATGEVIAAAG